MSQKVKRRERVRRRREREARTAEELRLWRERGEAIYQEMQAVLAGTTTQTGSEETKGGHGA